MSEPRQSPAHSLLVPHARRDELRAQSAAWPSCTVAGDALAWLEALLAGFLWPLQRYAAPWQDVPRAEPEAPLATRLAVPLDVPAALAGQLAPGQPVALRDPEGVLLAALHVHERLERGGAWALTGVVEGIELPAHDDFQPLRLGPDAIAARARALARPHVLACLPDDLLHAGTRAALVEAAGRLQAAILVLIAASSTEHDELAEFARVVALKVSASLLPAGETMTAVVPLPRSGDAELRLLRSALVARNCGASHLAVDVTENGADPESRAAESDTGVAVVPIRSWAYSRNRRQLVHPQVRDDEDLETAPPSAEVLRFPSAAPAWLLSTEEREALGRARVPRPAQGFTVFFTGLSGSGKSTIARALRVRLMETTGRPVTLLDGDRVRRHLSSELGFSREHRNLNILRIGWVASEITRHRGVAICAPIAPYDAIRRQVRAMVEPAGGFLLVHVSTPLETCEARDRKGLYARARAGLIPQFTGVSDPYEPPADAAVTIDTRDTSVDEACTLVIEALTTQGYLVPRP